MLWRHFGREFTLYTLDERTRHVLFDCEAVTLSVFGQIDNGEASAGYLSYNTVIVDQQAVGQGRILL